MLIYLKYIPHFISKRKWNCIVQRRFLKCIPIYLEYIQTIFWICFGYIGIYKKYIFHIFEIYQFHIFMIYWNNIYFELYKYISNIFGKYGLWIWWNIFEIYLTKKKRLKYIGNIFHQKKERNIFKYIDDILFLKYFTKRIYILNIFQNIL